MARMHPAAPAADAPASEKQVFSALREGLPKDWFVIHAQRLNLPRQGKQQAFEGEADFIVFHPERGLVVLEVKGGRIERDSEGWFSTDADDKRHSIKDPGKQAQRASHALGRYLREHQAFRHRRHGIPFGHGVVFPSVDVNKCLDPSLPRGLVLDRRDLQTPRESLERLYLARNLGRQAQIAELATPLLDAIAPTVDLLPSLQGRFDHEARILHRLTDEQKRLLTFIAANPRVAIQGVAGSGKTLVAMEKARQLAAEGQRVLFLCFNQPLANHLAPQAQGFDVNNYHRLCHERCQGADIPFEVPSDPARPGETKRFFAEIAPELLLQALEARPDDRYDALILDEGQDFLELWWPSVETLLRDPKHSTLYVFYDPNQNLFGGGPTQALGLTFDLNLTHNCRNTARIAEYSTALIDKPAVLHPDAPDGIPVEEIQLEDPAQTPATIQRILHRFCHEQKIPTEDIVILTTRSPKTSALATHHNLGNYHLVPLTDPLRPGFIRFTSIRKFKGLESPVILITDVDPTHHTSTPQDLHVGTSRARHALVVLRTRS